MNSKVLNKMAPYFLGAIFLLLIDRLLKIISLNYFQSKELPLIDDFFKFTFAPNYYIAFSLPLGGKILLLLNCCLIIGLLYLLIYWIIKQKYIEAGLLTFLVVGAISNMADRLQYGYVIDYFDLQYFTVFNMADVLITISAILLILTNIKRKEN
jgi:signal peptidase II